jgi:hypothetical protein
MIAIVEGRRLRQLQLAAFLEVLQRARGDAQALR